MRVVIDARLEPGKRGGVESVLVGLASGLAGLDDGDEEYTFLVTPRADAWIRPFLPAGAAVVPTWGVLPTAPAGRVAPARRSLPRRIARRLARPLVRAYRHRRPAAPPPPPDPFAPPRSDGTLERLAPDLVHFMTQTAFLTPIPSIYHPHDLQHVHMPEFFDANNLARRNVLYPAFCRQATLVATVSTWIRDDVERTFDLPPGKTVVVPFAPPIEALEDLAPEAAAEVRKGHGLPEGYVLYPAQTWAHKNHERLLEAIAILRRRGTDVPLACTGRLTERQVALRALAHSLGIEDLVHWLDFVPSEELRAIYQGATAIVIPTLYEAASAPLWEAFSLGVAAACSNVTSLPAQAGDAALIFDPYQPPAIADAIERLWNSPDLRQGLIERGRANVARFSWDRTARIFRAHYRRIGGRPLSEEDVRLLAAPPPF